MASYSVAFKRSAAKELADLPARIRRRLAARIGELAQDPRPFGSEKLSGEEKYRIRQGDYRVVYAIDDGQLIVTVFKVAHRRDVYR